MLHIIKAIAFVAGPLIGFIFYGHTMESTMVGLGISSFVIVAVLLFERIPLDTLIFGVIGGAGGLVLAKILDWIVFRFDNAALYAFFDKYSGLINVLMAFMGFLVAVSKKNELDLLDKDLIVKGKKNKDVKVLDTSVLIDGRICDVAETGFLTGRLIIPRFVLHELQMVADSSDATKRQRGRRGLDILKRLQETTDINVKIYDRDFPHIKEVDGKVLELAKELGGKVATTDFNLNKVAALQGISVLNINDLAGALKAVVLPGDSLTIFLAKEGKERSQAVGYLDDGTMVVVDDAKLHIGKRMNVHVNSILQTSAGRMIFARPGEAIPASEPKPAPHSVDSAPTLF